MVFKKMLASLGVGGAQVNTVLDREVHQPGGPLSGQVHLVGGSVDQPIDRLALAIEAVVEVEHDQSTSHQVVTIAHAILTQGLTLRAHQTQAVPFQLGLPLDVPLNLLGHLRLPIVLNLRTSVAIPGAVDPSDLDPLLVEPHPAQRQILEAMEDLGFTLFKADLEAGRAGAGRLPFYQELEYHSAAAARQGISEVELTFVMHERDMEVIFEMDRRQRSVMGMLGHSRDQLRGFAVEFDEVHRHDWRDKIRSCLDLGPWAQHPPGQRGPTRGSRDRLF